jgi:hypothetical protein
MSEGFDVNVGEVRVHATTVATLSTEVQSACGTSQGGMHNDAYGMIGQFFAAALILASDQVRDGILSAARSFMDVQKGLSDVADLYQQVDETRAQVMALTQGDGK